MDADELTAFCGVLGRMLSPHVMPGSRSGEGPPPADIRSLIDYAVAHDEPLSRLLYALATGDAGAPRPPGSDAAQQRLVLGPRVATDVLNAIFVRWRTVQATQTLVGNLMQDSNVPTRARNQFTCLGISSSRTTAVQRVKDLLEKLGDPTARFMSDSLVIAMLDNIGFSRLKTYEQFVLIAYLVVPHQKLVDLGIIAASNVSRVLDAELPTAVAYLAGEGDYKTLAERTAERIKSLLVTIRAEIKLIFK